MTLNLKLGFKALTIKCTFDHKYELVALVLKNCNGFFLIDLYFRPTVNRATQLIHSDWSFVPIVEHACQNWIDWYQHLNNICKNI